MIDCGIVAVRNPPASSDGQHSRAGRLPGLRLALVPPSDGPQRLGTHVRCWCKGVPPDLYLVRKVMEMPRLVSCMAYT